MTLAAYMCQNPPFHGSQGHLVWLAFQELGPRDQRAIEQMVEELDAIEDIGPIMALVIVYELSRFLVERGSI